VGLGGRVFIDKQRTNVGRYVHVQEREREKKFTLGKDFDQEEEDDEEEEEEEGTVMDQSPRMHEGTLTSMI
jgi:hypothetical protein